MRLPKLLFIICFLPAFALGQKTDCPKAEKLLKQAHLALDDENEKAALRYTKEALKNCPDSKDGILLLGDIYLDNLQLDSANQVFYLYLQKFPEESIAFRKLAGVQFFKNHYDSCHYFLDQALVLSPNDTVALFNKGEVYYYQHNWSKAELYYQLLLSKNPEDLMSKLRLCDIWTAENKTDECWKLLEEMKKKNYNNFDVILTEINLLIKNKSWDLALQKLENAQRIDSMETAVYFSRAIVYEETDKNDLALNEYNKIVVLDPENGDAYYQRGNLLSVMGQPELALADLTEALKLDSTLIEAWHQLGVVYYEMNMYQNSVDAFGNYLVIVTDDADAFFNRGNSYYALQQFKEAAEDFTVAIQLNPASDFFYNRSLAYFGSGEYSKSLADLNTYIAAVPSDAEALYIRCVCNHNLERTEEACMDCNQAVFLGKKDVPASFIKGCKEKKKKKNK